MPQVINGMQVDHGTIPNSRVLNDTKSLIEMSLDEYLDILDLKDEKNKLKAERAISNYHKKKLDAT